MNPKISGVYKEVFSNPEERIAKVSELELRVDVDGDRPLNIISGDLFSTSGDEPGYLGSFRFLVKNKGKGDTVVLTGTEGECSPFVDPFVSIKVTITRDSNSHVALVQLINSVDVLSEHFCEHKSEYFRRILIEHDYEEDVVQFESYDTKGLVSPSQRTHPITISSAFGEAGIEVIEERKQKTVPHPKGVPGGGQVWTDSQLNDRMLEHFTNTKEKPQWKLWLFSANEYVICTVKGIMIIQRGKCRKGCAVFQIATGWQTPEEKRLRLFIYMHELGHCFNLRHPWTIPQNGQDFGYDTLSWMNYPWRYRLSDKTYGGEDFWKDFNFQFSDSELRHLRHGFRNDVIFGGTSVE